MVIRHANRDDRAEWHRMRCALWPDDAAVHDTEIDEYLLGKWVTSIVFVAERLDGSGLCGFVEARLRDHAEGCTSSPVAYLEGWYVDSEYRRTGVGAALLSAFEQWGVANGATEAASDTEVENRLSRAAHGALGFEEVEDVTLFRKNLNPSLDW
ncbi:MAG: N-acetyltransferase family protein [Phycisphaerae bacterium]